ncbi:MAG TPA: XRE family transcriptional regulator [Bacteroidota bacterium]|nr:XRE family transcriptional regulator [Bacteroidota bacterium]
MTEQIRLIAERVKELRELSGTSMNALAAELGISTDVLQQYESGTVDIPVGFLHKVAQRFHVDLAVVLSGENPKLHVYCVVRKDKGLSVDRRKQYKYEELAANFVNKKAEPFIVRIKPEEKETPMEFNSHPGQEFNYVLEGTMKIVVDNHEVILHEGDSIYYDSSYKHAMKAATKQPVKFLAIVL